MLGRYRALAIPSIESGWLCSSSIPKRLPDQGRSPAVCIASDCLSRGVPDRRKSDQNVDRFPPKTPTRHHWPHRIFRGKELPNYFSQFQPILRSARNRWLFRNFFPDKNYPHQNHLLDQLAIGRIVFPLWIGPFLRTNFARAKLGQGRSNLDLRTIHAVF